jgi:flagellar protein FliO/FliZ
MNSLFGVELPTPVNFVIAFVVVLILIGAATWLVRRFGVASLDAASRGRQPRLAVIDAAAVDSRRKLVIIRRDNVEHLLMIGGPTDVVVETNIVRAATAATREAPAIRTNGGGEALPRAVPLPDPTPWPLQPDPAPAHAPPVQAARAERAPRILVDDPSRWDAATETPAAPPARGAARPADTLAGLASELSRPMTEPAPKPRVVASEPAAAAQPAAASASQGMPADQSLAEMAQRLEAALRRPTAQRLAEGGTARPANGPEAKPVAPPRIAVMQPRNSAPPRPQSSPQQSANLEQEMASLLGRPGKP